MTNPLGKKISSPNKFSPNILFPILRADQRQGITHEFKGKDIWNLHEVIWINKMGKVFQNELSVVIDASSPYTVESKSLKLFVNSFIHKRFNSISEVKKILRKYLEKLTKSNELYTSPYHVGSGLFYLDQYLGNKILEESLREFASSNGKEPFKTILENKSNKNLNWFFDY